MSKTNLHKIRLVGHSMGGVVASHYTLHHASKVEVTNVITLGSPLEGTHMAHITPGKCSRDMCYNGVFMKQFSPKIRDFKGETSFFHVGSKADLIIRPTNSATLSQEKALNTSMFPDLGHLTYLFHDIVIDTVINQINS